MASQKIVMTCMAGYDNAHSFGESGELTLRCPAAASLRVAMFCMRSLVLEYAFVAGDRCIVNGVIDYAVEGGAHVFAVA